MEYLSEMLIYRDTSLFIIIFSFCLHLHVYIPVGAYVLWIMMCFCYFSVLPDHRDTSEAEFVLFRPKSAQISQILERVSGNTAFFGRILAEYCAHCGFLLFLGFISDVECDGASSKMTTEGVICQACSPCSHEVIQDYFRHDKQSKELLIEHGVLTGEVKCPKCDKLCLRE